MKGERISDMSVDAKSPLTVVIPVYNRAERVAATLKCLENQSLRPLEIVLVDNNSTDDTLDVLHQWKTRVETPQFRVRIFKECQPGAAAARNRGLQEVTTEITMFFDSDDLMDAGHCERVVNGFMNHPDADIVGWDCRYDTGKMALFCHRDFMWGNLHYGSMSTQRYAAKTSLFRESGGWNPDCRGWDDVELGMRMLYADPIVVKLEGPPTVTLIHTPDSITGEKFSEKSEVWEHALEIMDAAVGEGKINVRRYINLRRAILSGDYLREGERVLSRRLQLLACSKETSGYYRFLNALARAYRGLGLRGAARLLRPFFR